MDHRIAKDMISSGMIPSGEKKKEDLSRTQYGSTPSPNALADAYKSMYDKKEEVINEHHKKDADGNTIPHEGEELNEGKIPAGLQAYLDKKKGKKEVKEGADLFDVIVTHFIDEGYEEKEVYKAMANLTEDQLQNLHEVLPALGAIGAALKSGAVASKVGAVAGKVGAFASKAGSFASKGLASAGKAIPTSIKNVGKTIKGNVSSGLNKPFNPRVTQGPKPAPMQGPRQANFGDKLKNIGRGVKDFYKSKDVGMGDKVLATTMAVDTVGKLGGAMRPRGLQKSDIDLFDIVKGKLLDEGLSVEEIKDIMLTLTPDEIIKEIEESSLSAGSSDGHYSDGGDGVFRSKQQVSNMFNKNIPAKKNGKVDKPTRKAINTSAKDFGIQGPSTLKQSVEPEGETI